MLKTQNPMLRENTYTRYGYLAPEYQSNTNEVQTELSCDELEEQMTLNGTAAKAILLLAITVASTIFSWNILFANGNVNFNSINKYFLSSIIGSIALITIVTFKHKQAVGLSFSFALFEGIFIASAIIYVDTTIPGLIHKTACLTFGVLFCVLVLFRSKIIKPNKVKTLGTFAAFGALLILCISNEIAKKLGHTIPLIVNNLGVDITINILLLILACCAIVSDFKTIEKGCNIGCPKHMEWYSAMSLILSMVWIYVAFIVIMVKIT